jgi:hypothetical protein
MKPILIRLAAFAALAGAAGGAPCDGRVDSLAAIQGRLPGAPANAAAASGGADAQVAQADEVIAQTQQYDETVGAPSAQCSAPGAVPEPAVSGEDSERMMMKLVGASSPDQIEDKLAQMSPAQQQAVQAQLMNQEIARASAAGAAHAPPPRKGGEQALDDKLIDDTEAYKQREQADATAAAQSHSTASQLFEDWAAKDEAIRQRRTEAVAKLPVRNMCKGEGGDTADPAAIKALYVTAGQEMMGNANAHLGQLAALQKPQAVALSADVRGFESLLGRINAADGMMRCSLLAGFSGFHPTEAVRSFAQEDRQAWQMSAAAADALKTAQAQSGSCSQ